MMNDRQIIPVDAVPIAKSAETPVPHSHLLPDPRLIWSVLRRNFKLFFGLVVLVWIAFLAAVLLITPEYSTRASILFETTPNPVQPDTNRQLQSDTSDLIETQMRLITSPDIVERVVADHVREHPNNPDGEPWTSAQIEQLGSQMLDALEVQQDASTRIVNLDAYASDPQFAADVANGFAEQYIQAQIASRSQTMNQSDKWLKDRLTALKHDAQATQAAVDDYKVRHNLVAANGATVAEQEVSALNQQIASAQADLAEKRGSLQAARAQIGRGGGGEDVGAALNSETVSRLRQQEAQLSADLAEMEERYGPDFPVRQQAEQRLGQVHASIQSEINRIISNLSADMQSSQSRLASLQASLGSAEGGLNANGRAQAVLNQLQQEALAARTVYQEFLDRSSEVSATRFLEQADARIVRHARVPTFPSYPDYKLAGLLALVASLGVGFSGVGLAEYLRRGIETKRDVEQGMRVHYAGAIPDLLSTTTKPVDESCVDYVLSHPRSLFAESFRNIRLFLTLSGQARTQVLAITSALPQEGKTTTAVCLARTTAIGGLRTLLIDTDFRLRGSSVILGFHPTRGLDDVLNREAPLHDALCIDEHSGLHVLGISEDGAMGELGAPHLFERLLQSARLEYDVIVIDTAPILGVADARQICSMADSVLLLSRWRETPAKAVEAAIDILEDSGAALAGIALTQVDIRRYASTGESDVFAYTQKFSEYYVA